MAIKFLDDEWAALTHRLLIHTRDGKVKWTLGKKTDDRAPNFYLTKLASGRGYVLASQDDDDKFPYLLHVMSQDDTVVTTFRTNPYSDIAIESNEIASENIDELYTLVERSVTGAAEAARSLLEELDELATPLDTDCPF